MAQAAKEPPYHCCDVGLIPGPGTSEHHEYGPKKKKKRKKKNFTEPMMITGHFTHPGGAGAESFSPDRMSRELY